MSIVFRETLWPDREVVVFEESVRGRFASYAMYKQSDRRPEAHARRRAYLARQAHRLREDQISKTSVDKSLSCMGGLWARAQDSAKMEEVVALLCTSSVNWNESSLKRGRSIRL